MAYALNSVSRGLSRLCFFTPANSKYITKKLILLSTSDINQTWCAFFCLADVTPERRAGSPPLQTKFPSSGSARVWYCGTSHMFNQWRAITVDKCTCRAFITLKHIPIAIEAHQTVGRLYRPINRWCGRRQMCKVHTDVGIFVYLPRCYQVARKYM